MRKKIVFLPYDMDTAIGITNEGVLAFSYNLEDIDQVNGADVFNGQKSVLWKNLRQTYYNELRDMYQTLRSQKKLSYQKIEQAFEQHQAKWPEAIFNEDAYFKYLGPLEESGDSAYLSMLLGSKEQQRKWWLYNRFKYIDSKYNAGDALTDVITLRGYAKDNITVIPYADIYASIKYGSYLQQARATRNEPVTITCPLDNVNDTEIYIYSASQLASIGDISGLKVGYANFSFATHLQSLKIGDSSNEYSNGNLTELYLGNNTLLKTIDVRNCPNLTSAIDLSGCTNLENVYFDGTSVTGVQLSNGGVVKVLHLPDTIRNLTLIGQKSLTDLTIAGYSSLSSLWLENNSSAVDIPAIISMIPNGCRVRLIGLNLRMDDGDDIAAFLDALDNMTGIDENGNNTNQAQVSGTISTQMLTGAQNALLQGRYPYLTITADHITAVINFYTWDGSTLLDTQYIADGKNATTNLSPSRSNTSYATYTFIGWNTQMDSNQNDPAVLKNITTDRNVYAAYRVQYQKYRVEFYNGDTLLQVKMVDWGSPAIYTGDTPVYAGDEPENYGDFIGWDIDVSRITGATTAHAEFRFIGYSFRLILDKTIRRIENNLATSIGDYVFYNCSNLVSVVIPNAESIGNYAFYGCSSLTTVSIPNTHSIGTAAFSYCSNLTEVSFPNVMNIDNNAFSSCASLTDISFLNVKIIEAYAFESCSKLTTVSIPNATSVKNNAFQYCSKLTNISFPNVTNLGTYAFIGCSKLTNISFPNVMEIGYGAFMSCLGLVEVSFPNATSIGYQAFNDCSNLTEVFVPNVVSVGTEAFRRCSSLINISFPNVTNIGSAAFTSCTSLTDIYLPNAADTYTNAPWNAPSTCTIHYNTVFDSEGNPII